MSMTTQTEDLRLREAYARERTFLSLDRTLLSYIRTAMTAIVVGLSLLKLFETPLMQGLGVGMIFVAFFLTVFGVIRTIQTHKQIQEYAPEKIQ